MRGGKVKGGDAGGGRRVAGHEGEDEGASTMLFLDRCGGTATIVLANDDAFHSADHARIAALSELVSDRLAAAAVRGTGFTGRRSTPAH